MASKRSVVSVALLGFAFLLQERSASPDPDAERRKAWFDEQAVYLKYRYGSASVAEEALLSHARKAAAKAGVAGTPESARAHLDAAFSYARLGILAIRAAGARIQLATSRVRLSTWLNVTRRCRLPSSGRRWPRSTATGTSS